MQSDTIRLEAMKFVYRRDRPGEANILEAKIIERYLAGDSKEKPKPTESKDKPTEKANDILS